MASRILFPSAGKIMHGAVKLLTDESVYIFILLINPHC